MTQAMTQARAGPPLSVVSNPCSIPRYRYLSRPDQWSALMRTLSTSPGPVAFDTEYEIPDGQTPAHRSVCHVWSVGWSSGAPANARGVLPAIGAVLPAAALDAPSVVAWLRSDNEKWAHNAGVDRHAIENRAGVEMGGVRCSLSLARWVLPERVAPGPGFRLDAIGQDLLGPGGGKTEDFLSLVTRDVTETRSRSRKDRLCECGQRPCRQRQATMGHTRIEVVTETPYEVHRTERFPLSEILPGHERWDRLVAYSAQDSLVGCELVQALLRKPQGFRNIPW